MRCGIFGGSFSPPHNGHVAIARAFMDEMSLDRLYIVPAKAPPHKKLDGGADAGARLAMCRAAFAPLGECAVVSEYEMQSGVSGYTVDTLRHFSGEGELFMLCGSDMFLTLGEWREPETIFSLATVVCASRVCDKEMRTLLESAANGYFAAYGGRSVIMDVPVIELSSSEVRGEIAAGKIPHGIPPAVYDIIRRDGLYGCPTANHNQ